MNYYSYLIEHDYGLAPNPFGKYCTLAVCKAPIRKSGNVSIGDWILGTGSKALEKISGKPEVGYLIYAMKVSEILSLENYWSDTRFQYKKPILNGSLVYIYGDNFYHKDSSGNWIQEPSAHSNSDGTPNLKHLKIDTGGKSVLVAEEFYYFGQKAPKLPESIPNICHTGIGRKLIPLDDGLSLITWLTSHYQPGIHGDPINWVEYNSHQLKLF